MQFLENRKGYGRNDNNPYCQNDNSQNDLTYVKFTYPYCRKTTNGGYMKDYYKLYKSHNICPNCKKQDAYTLGGRALCYECDEKDRQYQAERRKKPDFKEKRKIREQRWKERMLATGRCTRCGKINTDKRYKICGICRSKNKLAWKEKVALTDQNYPRGENGFCWDCNKEKALDGKRLCKKCYERQLPIALNGLEYAKGKSYFSKGFVYGKNAN